MKKFWRNHYVLIVCSLISVSLLVVFAILQHHESHVLKLNTQWILVAGVPILIALLVGGYIKKFKGFGVELESRLQTPVTSLSLKVTDAITDMPGDAKERVSHLRRLTERQVEITKRLSFVLGRTGYYDRNAIIRYFKKLRNLDYVEVTKRSGEFVCLIPIREFKAIESETPSEPFRHSRIDQFIRALEDETILSVFSGACINLTVKRDEGLIRVLEKLRNVNVDKAVVVSPEGYFLGVITSNDIERKIADDVLYSKRT